MRCIKIYIFFLGIALTACSGAAPQGPTTKKLGSFRLAQTCDEVRAYVQNYAQRAHENPGGIVPVQTDDFSREAPTSAAAGAEADQAPAADGGVAQSDVAFADTERGLLYTLKDQGLKIFRVNPSASIQLVSNLTLDFFPQEIVTIASSGKFYAALFGNKGGWIGVGPEPMPVFQDSTGSPTDGNFEEPKAVVVLLDVTDPQNPQEIKRETSPGVFLEARALTQTGNLLWVTQRFVPIYLENVSDAQIFPEKTVSSGQGASSQPLAGCDQTYLYENDTLSEDYVPYSLGSVVVSLLKLSDASVSSQAILSPAYRSFIAANPEHIYLAQNVDNVGRSDSELYQFDLGSSLSLSASVSVPGNIPNQFFIDEKAGVVRVFHHQSAGFGGCFDCVAEGGVGGAPAAALKAQETLQTGNYLSTYRQEGAQLALLGRTGPFEQDEIPYAARFLGNLGCSITFLQIDPLTCFDLKNPAQPVKLGELEIEGVSHHLEAVTDNLLLGIGVGASNSSVVANLFDISDPTHPTLASQKVLSSGTQWAYSPVFYDYRALGKDSLLRNFAVPIESGDETRVAVLSVDPASATLNVVKTISKSSTLNGNYDVYQRAFFFSETLAALSLQELEVFLRSNWSEVFSTPLGN